MIIVSPELEEVIEGRIVQIADRPIIFAQFLELGQPETWMELVNGVLEEKPMVQLDHELTEGWIYIVMRAYVQKRGLGMVVHSHFPVQINSFSGRLPDIVCASGTDPYCRAESYCWCSKSCCRNGYCRNRDLTYSIH